jgi:hypothetical protein
MAGPGAASQWLEDAAVSGRHGVSNNFLILLLKDDRWVTRGPMRSIISCWLASP